MRNQKLLESFTAYCKAHPQERFWQALRNWSGWGFIWVNNSLEMRGLRDTFYWEDNEKPT